MASYFDKTRYQDLSFHTDIIVSSNNIFQNKAMTSAKTRFEIIVIFLLFAELSSYVLLNMPIVYIVESKPIKNHVHFTVWHGNSQKVKGSKGDKFAPWAVWAKLAPDED